MLNFPTMLAPKRRLKASYSPWRFCWKTYLSPHLWQLLGKTVGSFLLKKKSDCACKTKWFYDYGIGWLIFKRNSQRENLSIVKIVIWKHESLDSDSTYNAEGRFCADIQSYWALECPAQMSTVVKTWWFNLHYRLYKAFV